MKVIPETRRGDLIWYLRLWAYVPDEGYVHYIDVKLKFFFILIMNMFNDINM
jgi:hypothetical protein